MVCIGPKAGRGGGSRLLSSRNDGLLEQRGKARIAKKSAVFSLIEVA